MRRPPFGKQPARDRRSGNLRVQILRPASIASAAPGAGLLRSASALRTGSNAADSGREVRRGEGGILLAQARHDVVAHALGAGQGRQRTREGEDQEERKAGVREAHGGSR